MADLTLSKTNIPFYFYVYLSITSVRMSIEVRKDVRPLEAGVGCGCDPANMVAGNQSFSDRTEHVLIAEASL